MKCPECGKEALIEGDNTEVYDLDPENRMWFCCDCLIMKRLNSTKWVKASKGVIAVMISPENLQELYAHYLDKWTWDEGDEDTREWVDILGEELDKRRNFSGKDFVSRLLDTRISCDGERFMVYIDGKWV